MISFNINDVRRVLPSSLFFLAHGYPRASLDEDSSPNGPSFDSLQLEKSSKNCQVVVSIKLRNFSSLHFPCRVKLSLDFQEKRSVSVGYGVDSLSHHNTILVFLKALLLNVSLIIMNPRAKEETGDAYVPQR